MNGSTVFTLFRLLAGGGLLWLAWRLGIRDQDPMMNQSHLVLAALSFLAAMVFLWGFIFGLLTKPLLKMVDLVFSPGGRLEKPVLNLKLPAHYLKEERYEEALDEYRRILKHYPQETEAWEKAIWLEAEIFGRPAEASKLVRAARRRGIELDQRVTWSLRDDR